MRSASAAITIVPTLSPGAAMPEPALEPPRPRRAHHWLAALPALFMLGGVPFANRVEPLVLGLPFLLFWVLLWVVLTSATMALIYTLDERAGRADAGGGDAHPVTDAETPT